MPRALYFFRWGAAWTWITGVLLFGIVYAMGGALVEPDAPMGPGPASALALAIFVVAFVVYDLLWKSLGKNAMAANVVSIALIAVLSFLLQRCFSGRAAYILIGATLGTIMAANVWMRIWPNQRRIISAIKLGQAPDAALVAVAGLRSRHNTFMSIPLLFMMVSNHYPALYGSPLAWVWALVIVGLGFALAKYLYAQSATPAPAQF
jgi:uncharacterized membrane protein